MLGRTSPAVNRSTRLGAEHGRVNTPLVLRRPMGLKPEFAIFCGPKTGPKRVWKTDLLASMRGARAPTEFIKCRRALQRSGLGPGRRTRSLSNFTQAIRTRGQAVVCQQPVACRSLLASPLKGAKPLYECPLGQRWQRPLCEIGVLPGKGSIREWLLRLGCRGSIDGTELCSQ